MDWRIGYIYYLFIISIGLSFDFGTLVNDLVSKVANEGISAAQSSLADSLTGNVNGNSAANNYETSDEDDVVDDIDDDIENDSESALIAQLKANLTNINKLLTNEKKKQDYQVLVEKTLSEINTTQNKFSNLLNEISNKLITIQSAIEEDANKEQNNTNEGLILNLQVFQPDTIENEKSNNTKTTSNDTNSNIASSEQVYTQVPKLTYFNFYSINNESPDNVIDTAINSIQQQKMNSYNTEMSKSVGSSKENRKAQLNMLLNTYKTNLKYFKNDINQIETKLRKAGKSDLVKSIRKKIEEDLAVDIIMDEVVKEE